MFKIASCFSLNVKFFHFFKNDIEIFCFVFALCEKKSAVLISEKKLNFAQPYYTNLG